MPRKISFSKKDIDNIIRHYLEPNSLRETSERFNLNRKVVVRILKENNIQIFKSVHRFTDDQIKNIIADYNKPIGIKEVAKKYNCSQIVISNLLIKNNIPTHTKEVSNKILSASLKRARKKLFDNNQELSIINFYLEPHSIRETSNKFNCSKATISRILKRNNIKFHDKDIIRNIKNLKTKETSYKRFGVSNFSKTIEHKKFMKDHNREFCNRKYYTMKKNNTFNSSSPERDFEMFLNTLYTKSDIIHQYKDSRYPYFCDFYIKSKDLFIELNLHWTHGKHPFDKNSKEDLEKLETWKTKHTKYYDKAIRTWTERDIEKQEMAKKNNLNYYVFYSIEDAYDIIKNI